MPVFPHVSKVRHKDSVLGWISYYGVTHQDSYRVSTPRYCKIAREEIDLHRYALVLLAVFGMSIVAGAQIKKLRVLGAPGVTQSDQKDWDNTLSTSASVLTLDCQKCSPIHTVAIPVAQIGGLKYGQNAYHHWVSGIVTGVFSLGVGAIVGFMPHHQHFFSVDLKDGKVLAIQADKSDYKQVAEMLENSAGLPIEVSAKDAHFLAGFNTKVVAEPAASH